MSGRADELSPVKREAFLRLRARPAGPAGPLVILRQGDAPTGVVLVHPVGGALLCYVPMLERLPVGTPVVGFAMEKPVEDLPDADRIAGLADRYLAALAGRAGPPRRWLYTGWSFGGAVAYEMGRSAGPGSAVVMWDSDPHGRDGLRAPDEATVRWYFADDLARLVGVPREQVAAARPAGQAPTPIGDLLARFGLQTELSEAELAHRYRVFAANTRALAAYLPGRSDAAVTWVRSPRPAGAPNPWLPYCPGLRVQDVAGADHYTLLSDAHVDVAGRVVIEALAAPTT